MKFYSYLVIFLVIRQNHREMPSTSRQSTANMPANRGNIHWSYQNLTDVEHGILEPTYVDPIPNPLYANNDDAGKFVLINVGLTQPLSTVHFLQKNEVK
ncbi:hypothetical protein F2P79_002882 [Pimephales promelas]|nr:hypothetical protein F2P79_002882 [Pimephales promelas]KAG1967501.1 hypothetical protein F2P79_002882 [Pimephales promelas]